MTAWLDKVLWNIDFHTEATLCWTDEKFRNLQGTYPVISISFAGIKESDYEKTRRKSVKPSPANTRSGVFLLKGELLAPQEKDTFRRKTIDMDDVDASLALRQLADYLSRYYKKTIILLDEYDTPYAGSLCKRLLGRTGRVYQESVQLYVQNESIFGKRSHDWSHQSEPRVHFF